MVVELDDVDRAILHLLQEDARNTTATAMAEEIGVTATTVRNRIDRLEESGVITGYVPLINYERTERQLHLLAECTVPIPSRHELAERASMVDGVVAVREVMTGQANIRIEIVASETDGITRAVSKLAEQGLEVEDEELLKRVHFRPFDGFGIDALEE